MLASLKNRLSLRHPLFYTACTPAAPTIHFLTPLDHPGPSLALALTLALALNLTLAPALIPNPNPSSPGPGPGL